MFRQRLGVETFTTFANSLEVGVAVNARLIRTIAVATGAFGLAGGLAAGGAPSASAGTDAYFQITGAGLSISEPSATGGVNLGSVSAGSLAVQGNLGDVTVTDNRALSVDLAVWTATVSSTEFVRDGAGATPPASEKVAKANIAYAAGAPSIEEGGVFLPGTVASMDLAPELRIAGTFAGVGGINTVTWNPTVTFTLLNSQIAGTYRGTITHSVA